MPQKPKTRLNIREGDKYLNTIEETEAELMAMSRKEVIEDLTEKERKFCEYYINNFNCKTSALKAGYASSTANMIGWRVRQKYACNRYICWMKLKLSKRLSLSAEDFIEQYARIAFADIADFVDITKAGRVKVKPADELDGQVIKRLREGVQGVEIELEDRMKALDKLEKYFDVMPKDWKQKLEERKMAILEERLEMEKADRGLQQFTDDGFIEALKDSASELWDTEMDEIFDN